MDWKILDSLDAFGNEMLIDGFKNHGLPEGSKVYEAVKNMALYKQRDERVFNQTESRMTMYMTEINEYLYPDNSFMMKSRNDAAFAASGQTKRLNDSVIGPTVTQGRFQPLTLNNGDNAPMKTAKVRRNGGHVWQINYFHTDPDVISMELTSEIPYEAVGETLEAHAMALNTAVANYTIVTWAQGTVGTATSAISVANGNDFFVFTSGSNRASTVPAQTNTLVKSVSEKDLRSLAKKMRRQRTAAGMLGNVYVLPTDEALEDIRGLDDFMTYERTGMESRRVNGEIGKIYGMTILDPRFRDDWQANVLYSYASTDSGTTATLTKVSDTAVAADNMVSACLVAWVDTMVLRAEGNAMVFPWLNSPIYLGDVYAIEQRFGAIKKRGDNRGVCVMVENPYTS